MTKKCNLLTVLNILFLILLSGRSVAQNKYWVELTAKEQADQSLLDSKRKWSSIASANEIIINYYSVFLDVYSVSTSAATLSALQKSGFIKSFEPVRQLRQLGTTLVASEYSFALEQLKAWYVIDSLGLSGKGVKLGVIDGGFMGANKEPTLSQAFKNDQLIYFSDYLLNENTDPFYGKRIASDDHGTDVLKMIIGKDDFYGLQTGMATNASLYLARTDHGIRENRLEEDYWIMALENLYTMGVRLVNTSLGYTNTFDKKKENHKVNEVDGKSSMITRAAQKAAERGMLIVISAGNDGNSKWKVLSLPADAKDVMTVGASNFGDWSKLSYSSIGPEKLAYVKPDISCFSANGTSFAAPVITGLAACIWEYDSTLTNYEIMDIIKRSGHLAEVPNNYLGYGVPDASKIMKLLRGDSLASETIYLKAKTRSVDLTKYNELLQIEFFHKTDSIHVNEHGIMRRNSASEELLIEQPGKNIKYTTIASKNAFILEVIWPD